MADGAKRDCSSGLVLSSSTHTRVRFATWERIEANCERMRSTGFKFDPKVSRLKKMKHGVLTAARLQTEQAARQGFRYRAAMVTLTYRAGCSWERNHVRDFMTNVRNYMDRRGEKCRYVWVAELQDRGAVHYHVLFWLPKGMTLPKPDKRGWWPWGSTRIEWARKAAGYLAKYASKGDENTEFPRCLRISGLGGLDKAARIEFRFWRAPKDAREFFGPGADIKRCSGGRVNAVTGEFWESPWRFLHIAGVPHIIQKGAYPC